MSDTDVADGTPRILLVTKGLDIGGIERMVVDLAIGLTGRGVHVEVATVNDSRAGFAGQLRNHAVPILGLGGTDRIGLRGAWGLVRAIRSGRYDVIHIHGPLPAVVARCVPGRVHIVTTSHTIWSGLRRSTRLAWFATSWRDRASIAVSSAVAESMPHRIARRAVVVPHGVDLEAVEAARARAHASSDRRHGDDTDDDDDDSVVAICVASHRDVKNYPNLLRALALARREVPNLRLLAVGDGVERLRHEELAADLGISDSVRFVDATPDVLDLMVDADLLVVASDFEGQPLVVMEAMALGLPVVATAVGRVPELLSPSAGRIVSPGNSVELARALVEVAGDSALRRRLGEAARADAGNWTLDDVVSWHLELYRSMRP